MYPMAVVASGTRASRKRFPSRLTGQSSESCGPCSRASAPGGARQWSRRSGTQRAARVSGTGFCMAQAPNETATGDECHGGRRPEWAGLYPADTSEGAGAEG